MNLLRLFLSPLYGLGLLSRISLVEAISSSSSLLLVSVSYSDVSSSSDVVSWGASGLCSALGSCVDVEGADRSGEGERDAGGLKMLVRRWGAILYFWLLIQ